MVFLKIEDTGSTTVSKCRDNVARLAGY